MTTVDEGRAGFKDRRGGIVAGLSMFLLGAFSHRRMSLEGGGEATGRRNSFLT